MEGTDYLEDVRIDETYVLNLSQNMGCEMYYPFYDEVKRRAAVNTAMNLRKQEIS